MTPISARSGTRSMYRPGRIRERAALARGGRAGLLVRAGVLVRAAGRARVSRLRAAARVAGRARRAVRAGRALPGGTGPVGAGRHGARALTAVGPVEAGALVDDADRGEDLTEVAAAGAADCQRIIGEPLHDLGLVSAIGAGVLVRRHVSSLCGLALAAVNC